MSELLHFWSNVSPAVLSSRKGRRGFALGEVGLWQPCWQGSLTCGLPLMLTLNPMGGELCFAPAGARPCLRTFPSKILNSQPGHAS